MADLPNFIDPFEHRERSRGSTYVYVVGPVNENKPSKIGMAEDVTKRIGGLRTSHYLKLEIKMAYLLFDRLEARLAEAATHKHFAKFRIRGEWFDVDCDEVSEFIWRSFQSKISWPLPGDMDVEDADE